MRSGAGRRPAALNAPCGMNCRLCYAFKREKNPCPGCRGDDAGKPKTRALCPIKHCEQRRRGHRYCFDCKGFPCSRLQRMDLRYRARYGMSVIENLVSIQENGIRWFTEHENRKWTCPKCGRLLCVHRPHCSQCGHAWREGLQKCPQERDSQ